MLKLQPTAYLRYIPDQKMSLQDISEKFKNIGDLLILLTDSEYRPKQIFVTLEQNGRRYKHYASRYTSEADAPDWHLGPTNFRMVQQDFGRIYSAWEDKLKKVGSGFYSYLATKRGMPLYIEDEFKNLIGGLEAFHRKTNDDPLLTERQQKKIDSVMSKLQGNDRRWAKKILSRVRLTELPLEERLYQVINTARPSIDSTRLRKFTEQCRKDRNDLSHWAGQRHTNDNSQFYSRLTKANQALAYLYHALILDQIGVKKEIIDTWFQTGFMSHRIKDALADVELLDKAMLEAEKNAEREKARKMLADLKTKKAL